MSISGATDENISEQVQQLIKEHKVMVFSKTSCQYFHLESIFRISLRLRRSLLCQGEENPGKVSIERLQSARIG